MMLCEGLLQLLYQKRKFFTSCFLIFHRGVNSVMKKFMSHVFFLNVNFCSCSGKLYFIVIKIWFYVLKRIGQCLRKQTSVLSVLLF